MRRPGRVAFRMVAAVAFCSVMGVALSPPPAPPPVEQVEGRGQLAVLACIGCIGGLTFSARGTLLGFLVNTWLYPDATVACAYVCYGAVS